MTSMRLDVGRGRPSGQENKLEALAQQAAAARHHSTSPCDASSNSVRACAEAMTEAWGGMDVVIPNAGIGHVNPLRGAASGMHDD